MKDKPARFISRVPGGTKYYCLLDLLFESHVIVGDVIINAYCERNRRAIRAAMANNPALADKLREYANSGGGFQKNSRCWSTVTGLGFSIKRSHTVAELYSME